MAASKPTGDMPVAEVLERWPETVPVFQVFKMACVGCAMAPFDTMADAARIYELDLSLLMEAVNQSLGEQDYTLKQ
jgi:hybrid cluster-associated redox disulfide protein